MSVLHNQRYLRDIRKELRNCPTRAEQLLWMKLKGSRMGYKFRRQHSIGSLVVDFYCPSCKLAIEIDGETHSDPVVLKKDSQKDAFLQEKGYVVKRISHVAVVEDIEGAAMRIQSWCEELKPSEN